jgi:hypothetical protein
MILSSRRMGRPWTRRTWRRRSTAVGARPQGRGTSWRPMIWHARREIAKRARGGLQDYAAQYLATAYRQAREDAADETDLSLTTFPEACPWSVEQGLSPNFWSEDQP